MPISDPAVSRLPLYRALAAEALGRGEAFISCTTIAEQLSLSPVLVRKDLESTGIAGQPRRGFRTSELLRSLEESLAWGGLNKACLIGAGRLGSALLEYPHFSRFGLNLLAGFDIDRRKVGRTIGGKPVYPLERLPPFARQEGVLIAVLTVPAEAAQCVAELAVQAGIRGLWNFTEVQPVVPSEVIVQRVELAASLALLSKRMTEALRSQGAAPGASKALGEHIHFNV
jgi:redox-sensing transcriptional repressor